MCSTDSVGIADDGVTGEESCGGVVAGGDMKVGRAGGMMLGGCGSETGSL